MKTWITYFVLFTFSLQAIGSEVWVASPKPINRESLEEIVEKYRTQIKEADFISSYDYFLGHPASASQMAVILDLDSTARAAVLNGSFKKALVQYQTLAEKLKTIPNVAGVEKITLSTRINLAHMGTMLKIAKAESLWKEAHAWSPNALLSPEEFSPAVILQFSKPTFSTKKYTVRVKSIPEAVIFIDGERLKPLSKANPEAHMAALESGTHQLSAITPGYEWTIKNIEVKPNQNVQFFKIVPRSIVQGTCDQPQFIGTEPPLKTRILVEFDGECPRVYSNHNWYNIEGAKIITQKTATVSDDFKPGANDSGTLRSAPEKESFFGNLTKSGWFWAGLGAVVVGAVVISSSQTTTVPSHTMQ